MLIGLIYYIVKKTDRLDNTKLYKVVIFSLIGIFIISLTEMLFVPLMLYFSKFTMNELSSNITYNALFSIPTRIFQILIVVLIVFNKTLNIKLKNIIYIFRDKASIIYISIALIISLFLFIVLTNLFLNAELIIYQSNLIKIFFAITIFSLPTIVLGVIILSYFYYTNKIIKIEKRYSNMLEENEQNHL
jgi:hypothetical protein